MNSTSFENYSINISIESQFELCHADLDFDIVFIFISTLLFLISLLALLLESLLFLSLIADNALPINAKIILLNLSFASAILSLSFILQSLWSLVVQTLHYPLITIFHCSSLQSIRIIAGSAVLSFTFIIGIERFIASRRAVKGKDQTQISLIILSFTVITWLWSVGNLFAMLLRNYRLESVNLCFCDIVLLGFPTGTFITYTEVCVSLEVILVLIFWGFWLHHRKLLKYRGMNKAQHSLSERMSILESILLTNMLSSSITLKTVCDILYAISVVFGNIYISQFNAPWGINLFQTGHFSIAMYCLLNPIIIFRVHPNLNKSLLSFVCITVINDFLLNRGLHWGSRKGDKYSEENQQQIDNYPSTAKFDENNLVKLNFDSIDVKEDNECEVAETKLQANSYTNGTVIVVRPLSQE